MGLAKGLGKRIPDCHGAAAPSRTPLARSRTTRANTAPFHHRAGYAPSRNKEKKKKIDTSAKLEKRGSSPGLRSYNVASSNPGHVESLYRMIRSTRSDSSYFIIVSISRIINNPNRYTENQLTDVARLQDSRVDVAEYRCNVELSRTVK